MPITASPTQAPPLLITAGGKIRCVQCTAMSKRTKVQCRAAATKGKTKCRFHGGASTGPKTAAGRKRSGAKFLVHGRETKEIRTERRVKTAELQDLEALGRAIGLIVGPKTRGPKVKLE
jgi:hypothetical protein